MPAPVRRHLTVAVVAVIVATAALAVPGGRASAAGGSVRACRPVTVTAAGKRHGYSVVIDQGKVTCVRARSVIQGFLARAASPRGWFCVRGHASQHQKWAAQCANQTGSVVKAFGPLKG